MFDYITQWQNSTFDASIPSEWITLIRKYLKGKSVLDIGCGMGRFVSVFDGYDYTGLDISYPAIEFCKSKYEGKFICADLVKFDTKKKYDNIFSWVTLEHIVPEHIGEVCEKIKKWGNNLIITEPMGFADGVYCFSHDYPKLLGVTPNKVINNITRIMNANQKL
jgi:SAM-dependent methyltransferase